jgi:hypothetical protein
MPLLEIFRTNPDQIYALQIQQVIALCGNGKLRDGSACSVELTGYLSQAPSEKLIAYIESCLQSTFENSGYVLQDLVNELGRRLDHKVENGLYQGRSNAIGFDGIWHAPNGHALVVEVKTSDAYRINLDILSKYREDLINFQKIDKNSSILVVVGRQDTGDLEAQVRGSKHAWDIRLISVDALAKLVKLKEETEQDTIAQIHEILIPFEYTKLDRIIEVAFTAAKDAGAVVQQETLSVVGDVDDSLPNSEVPKQEHTSQEVLTALRQRIVTALAVRETKPLIRKSAALYWSADQALRVVCSVSKRHERRAYWYAYHPEWDKFLGEGQTGYYVLGCVDKDEAYAIPHGWIHGKLETLYTTERDNKMYWHIHVDETTQGDMLFRLFKVDQKVSLLPYRIALPKATTPGERPLKGNTC